MVLYLQENLTSELVYMLTGDVEDRKICSELSRFDIVDREEGLEAGGVAKLCYCSMSRDNTSASKSDPVIRDI